MIINKSLWIGTIMFILLLLAMTIGPFLPFIDSELKEEIVRFEGEEIHTPPYPPSMEDPFGSDGRGRDLLSLIIMGTNDTLAIILAVSLIRYIIAIPLGFAATKKSGPAHWLLTGWNQLFSALPTLFSAIILMNIPFLIFSDKRLLWSIIIIALIEVGRVSYIIQQQSYTLSKELFVEAAVTMGYSLAGNYRRNYFPNLLPEIIVNFFIDMGRVALLIGQLGMFSIFINQKWMQLGFSGGEMKNTGINWATLLGGARGDLIAYPWKLFFPALAITFTIIMFNLLGEGLRKHFEKKGL